MLLEVRAHEVLTSGCQLQMRLLQEGDKMETIQIEASDIVDKFDSKIISPSVNSTGPYHELKSKMLKTIDAFYLPKLPEDKSGSIADWNKLERLILFQTTISKTHPVNAADMIYVIEELGLLESVKDDPTRVALVFVVPNELVGDFQRQEIVPDMPHGDEDITKIRGIGLAIANELKRDYDIVSISNLVAAVVTRKLEGKSANCTRALNIVQVMRDIARSSRAPGLVEWKVMNAIPQYVCSLQHHAQT